MAISKKAVEILANKNDIPFEQVMKVMEDELENQRGTDALLFVPYRIGTTLYRSMNRSSRFFREIRDNGMFYAGVCPECGHKVMPLQRAVCHRCIKKGFLSEYRYEKLGPEVTGICVSWSRLVRGTSKQGDLLMSYPSFVKVDGCDNAHWQIVYPAHGREIKIGARVRSALRSREERTGEISDYWFVLD